MIRVEKRIKKRARNSRKKKISKKISKRQINNLLKRFDANSRIRPDDSLPIAVSRGWPGLFHFLEFVDSLLVQYRPGKRNSLFIHRVELLRADADFFQCRDTTGFIPFFVTGHQLEIRSVWSGVAQ